MLLSRIDPLLLLHNNNNNNNRPGPLPQPRLVLQAPLAKGDAVISSPTTATTTATTAAAQDDEQGEDFSLTMKKKRTRRRRGSSSNDDGGGGGGGSSSGGTGIFFNNRELRDIDLARAPASTMSTKNRHVPVHFSGSNAKKDSTRDNNINNDDDDADERKGDEDDKKEHGDNDVEEEMDLDFSSPVPPTPEMEPVPMPDIEFINQRNNHNNQQRHHQHLLAEDTTQKDYLPLSCPLPEDDDDAASALSKATLCKWKPFVNRVARFIEMEEFPFEYVDIWVVDHNNNNKRCDTGSSPNDDERSMDNGGAVLKHIGHATNKRTELCSIFTMYHMNQFGDDSEKYVFRPGVGLPGRVLSRGEPIWDDKLSNAITYTDFPRTNLAKKHGVKKGLGIPLVLPEGNGFIGDGIGEVGAMSSMQAIIVLYTSQDTMSQDYRCLVQSTYHEFQKKRIHLAVSTTTTTTQTRHNQYQSSCVDGVDQMDVDMDDDDDDDAAIATSYQAILPSDMEVEIATILRDYYETQQGYDDNNKHRLENTFGLSLQCLLWRAPCHRSLLENKHIDVLKRKYQQFFSRSREQQAANNKDVTRTARMLVDAWEEVSSTATATAASSSNNNNITIL